MKYAFCLMVLLSLSCAAHAQDDPEAATPDTGTDEVLDSTPSPSVPEGTPATPSLPGAETLPPRSYIKTPGPAVLQALDKVSARVQRIEAPLGKAVTFGSLQIIARDCQKTPPEDQPEVAAYLEITDTLEVARKVFNGWMFASSPALSAMEHPVYDVQVLDCMNASNSAPVTVPVSR